MTTKTRTTNAKTSTKAKAPVADTIAAKKTRKTTATALPPAERAARQETKSKGRAASRETPGVKTTTPADTSTVRHAEWVRTPDARSPQAQAAYDAAAAAWDFGQAVHDRRTGLGWSQAELARVAGMQPQAISRLELGGTTPTLPLIKRLARALGVTAEITLDTPDEDDPDGVITITLTPHAA